MVPSGLNGKDMLPSVHMRRGLDSVLGGSWQEAVLCPCDVGHSFIVYCDEGLSIYGLLVTQSCQTLCNPMDCSLPGSSVHGIFQAIVMEWTAISLCIMFFVLSLTLSLKSQ